MLTETNAFREAVLLQVWASHKIVDTRTTQEGSLVTAGPHVQETAWETEVKQMLASVPALEDGKKHRFHSLQKSSYSPCNLLTEMESRKTAGVVVYTAQWSYPFLAPPSSLLQNKTFLGGPNSSKSAFNRQESKDGRTQVRIPPKSNFVNQ